MFINNNRQLKQFCDECQKVKYIAVDTEFFWVNSYKPIPCLIQLATSRRVVLIDPLGSKLNFVYLRKIFQNKNIIKIFHSARQDLEILFNIFSELPQNIFDTQIGVLPLGFEKSISLKKLYKKFLNVDIQKNDRFIDWRKRPLTKIQIKYAANDVKYLVKIYLLIICNLNYFNRLDWVDDQHKKLLDEKNYLRKEKTAWTKLKFKMKYSSENDCLKKICFLRERLAKLKNIPPKHILTNSEVIRLSKRKKSSKQNEILSKISDEKLYQAIGKILTKKKINTDTLLDKSDDKLEKKKIRIAQKILIEKAELLQVEPSLIANKNDIVRLIKKETELNPASWKYEVFGKYINKL